MASGGGGCLHVDDIFQLLESADTEKATKEAILESLQLTKETWMIHLLIDYYFRTQSTTVQEIIAELRESQSKALVDKLTDGVKSPETRLQALQLVLYLVYRELPWCRQLVEMPIFYSILKTLKTEVDVPILMTSLMIVVILLPSCPVSMGTHLPHIFEIFGRLSSFCVRKPANTPDVFLLHLQVSLYSLFHRLYGMYPCLFTSYISKHFTQKENILVFEEVIMPMLERVRLHPKLIVGQKEAETSMNRWKNQETQDIIVNCSKLSLDLIEGSSEDSHCPVFQSLQSFDKYRALNTYWNDSDKRSVVSGSPYTPNLRSQCGEETSFGTLCMPAFDLGNIGESPSVLIGLSTPPSSHRTTPAMSFLEPAANSGGTFCDTPDNVSRQQTPSQTEDGEKTPVSRISRVPTLNKSGDSKKGNVMSPKPVTSVPPTTPVTPVTKCHSHTSPLTPVGHVENSPFKARSSAFGAPVQMKTHAMRNLQFVPTVEEKAEEDQQENTLKYDTKMKEDKIVDAMNPTTSQVVVISTEEQEGASRAKLLNVSASAPVTRGADTTNKDVVAIDSLPNVIQRLVPHESEMLDLEVEEINSEREDQFDEHASPSSSSLSTLASQTETTAESVRQFMKKVNRIRFNSLTSNSSSDVDFNSDAQKSLCKRPRSCPPFKRVKQPGAIGSSQVPRRRRMVLSAEKAGVRKSAVPTIRQKSATDTLVSEDSSDDISSHSSNLVPSPQKGMNQVKKSVVEDNQGETLPGLPEAVKPVFQCILAPAKLAVCSSCQHQLVLTSSQSEGSTQMITTFKGSDVSLFSLMSPSELLDRHLRLGSDIHAKELTKIPLTSKDTVNWTHFGGVPPADEVNILKGQILLMQNQLMYERHKRSNHAKRNRRLLRKITHVAMLEEQQKSLADQMRVQEQEIQQLSVSVKLLQEDNRRMKQSQESDDYQKLVQFKTALKDNKDMKASSIALKNLLLTQREDYDKLQKKLESVQHNNLENEKELEICKERLSLTDKLKQQVFKLQKEVLLTQELNQKYQERLQQGCLPSQRSAEQSYVITALKAEVAGLSKENKKMSNLLEAYQTQVIELEEEVKTKANAVIEIKRNFETAKSCHNEGVKAVEDRYKSMLRMCQVLEAKVMELTCQLDQKRHKQMMEATRSRSASGASRQARLMGSQEGGKPGELLDSKPGELDFTPVKEHENEERKCAEAAGGAEAVANKGPSVIVARETVSRTSSTFTDFSSEVTSSSSHPSLGLGPADLDPFRDSGVPSRASERGDSDVSMRSVSGHSCITGDSGCWPKVD